MWETMEVLILWQEGLLVFLRKICQYIFIFMFGILSKEKLELPAYFDGSYLPEGQEMVPYRVAIPRLNRYMIAHSDFVIAYVKNITGGAYVSLEYAEKLQKQGKLHVWKLI